MWDRYFPRRPQHPNRHYLESRISYKIQKEAYGGLSAATKERLIAIGRKHSKIKTGPTRSEFHFAPGTKLIREWGDRDHQVTVTAEGSFKYAGQRFKSLSAVARHITGALEWTPFLRLARRGVGRMNAVRTHKPPKRGAVCCRVSSVERLDQEFSSIDALKEAGHAFIASERAEGWLPVTDDYDDPGFSGGTIERPALKRLLTDIKRGKIDVVVWYKIDRLSRSLADFARMVEIFDRRGVSFSAVTQQINSATSMGRLMLNVLFSFAQFKREVTGQRIRDKFVASKKKGLWTGGRPPLRYDVVQRRLVVNLREAAIVQRIFADFARLQSVTA